MTYRGMRWLILSAIGIATASSASAQVDVSFDPASGLYQVFDKGTGYRLTGTIGQSPTDVVTLAGKAGKRTFHETRFRWNPGVPVEGSIKWFDGSSEVWFAVRYKKAIQGSGVTFPDFTSLPAGLQPYSFQDDVFAPPSFSLNETSTPWLFFDETAHSFILSPASNFLVAKMRGDGKTMLGVGLNDRLKGVPKGLTQESLLTFGSGIGRTWNDWGVALRGHFKRKVATPQSDVLIDRFGYWTDNGADYYYNYDLTRGYANTLLDLRKRYDSEGIPLAYLQLDSWWYQKTIDDADGRPGGKMKNSRLPEGSWNRYGGLWEYRAHPDLFPTGLDSFQRKLDLPLAVHNRWVDHNSPYHQKFKISGVGAIDPAWWNQVAEYLHSSGVTCYEQDWLDHIYNYSPDMWQKVGVADAFADGMANACKKQGLTMQYCMATPRFFLQGVKYDNLTTIRTSDDRFNRGQWSHFIETSQLADAVGILPWCDVFKSGETGNLILSVLSAGPVGTGDAIGKEDKQNIFRSMRADGVIIKPDHPIEPTDQTYLDQAQKLDKPFVASTYTDHSGLRTNYVFVFTQGPKNSLCSFKPSDAGATGNVYAYNFAAHSGKMVDSSQPVEQQLATNDFGYWMFAPVTRSGIVLLGDVNKIVPTGKQRIASIEDRANTLVVHVALAANERSVAIDGVSSVQPIVSGSGKLATWSPESGRFTVEVTGASFTLSTKPKKG